jgi:lipopolysaccharide transport system ATP-binding protein
MGDVARHGRTVLFISHNMGAVSRLCDRAVWLDQGRLRMSGDSEDVIAQYLSDGAEGCGEVNFERNHECCPGSDAIRLLAARIRNQNGVVTNSLDVRHPFTIEMQFRILRPIATMRLGLRVLTSDGVSVFTSRDIEDSHHQQDRQPGVYVSRCTVPGNFLNYGQYFVSFGADCANVMGHFSLHQVLSFQIEATGGVGGHIAEKRLGILRMRLPWVIEEQVQGEVYAQKESSHDSTKYCRTVANGEPSART